LGGSITRRRFIRGASAVAGAAALSAVPGVALAKKAGLRKAYRLSWRGQFCCNACKSHAANRFYFNEGAAQHDRPHAGCNCRIVAHWLPVLRHQQYFGAPPGRPRTVFDLRWR